MQPLPVDQVIPELLTALADHQAAVLHAPPGSGKTSRVPLALLRSELPGTILMLQPRRLAAVNAASWLAACLREPVGQTVGYAIRFDRKVSHGTRLEILTEGLLTRRLQSDPTLEGVAAVIFDEFHERTLHADTALALCLEIQKVLRPELKIIVMSATMECGPVAALLGDAPVISCTGRTFPVELRYLGLPAGDVAAAAAAAVRRALGETSGDVLAFLPGSAEIRRCHQILAEASPGDPLFFPLYGDLPFAEQQRAIAPAGKRKVVLATNIAETSLTIEGVTVVVDAGLARKVSFDAASGMNRMRTVRISGASAAQRAGRAGRTAPGTCYRLWSRSDDQTLVPYDQPEIRCVDLTPLALELANWGTADYRGLSWLDPPGTGAMADALGTLRLLGALDAGNRITTGGRKMAALPLHPRLAALVLEGERLGSVHIACDLAALLSERDICRRDDGRDIMRSRCDFTDRLEFLDEWRSGSRGEGRLDNEACRQVERVAAQLRRLVSSTATVHQSADLSIVPLLLLRAFPDRVAMQRPAGSDRYLLASGTGARLGQGSSLHDEPFLVAVETVAGTGTEGVIHRASAVTVEQIRTQFADGIVTERRSVWDSDSAKVITTLCDSFGALQLSVRSAAPTEADRAAALLQAVCSSPGLNLLPWSAVTRQMQARAVFLGRVEPNRQLPDIADTTLCATAAEWLGPALAGQKSLADIRRLDLHGLLRSRFTWDQLRLLDEGAPVDVAVPSGSRIRIDYAGDEPSIAVKLQELFGLAESPRIAWGRVPLVIHLLSPAQRPIQVTRDLRSFWETTYTEVKKELKGRYPKHPWPDDPWRAVPTKRTVKGMNR